MTFLGVLTQVDVPIDRSPSGARGHLVILTRAGVHSRKRKEAHASIERLYSIDSVRSMGSFLSVGCDVR